MSNTDDLSTETTSEPSDDGERENRAVNVRLPAALLAELDDELNHYHSRSEFVRDAIRARLRREE